MKGFPVLFAVVLSLPVVGLADEYSAEVNRATEKFEFQCLSARDYVNNDLPEGLFVPVISRVDRYKNRNDARYAAIAVGKGVKMKDCEKKMAEYQKSYRAEIEPAKSGTFWMLFDGYQLTVRKPQVACERVSANEVRCNGVAFYRQGYHLGAVGQAVLCQEAAAGAVKPVLPPPVKADLEAPPGFGALTAEKPGSGKEKAPFWP